MEIRLETWVTGHGVKPNLAWGRGPYRKTCVPLEILSERRSGGSRELDFNFPKGVLAFRRRFGQETQCSQVTADVILPVLYPCCEEPNLASPT
jgi:hypothetical protein